MSQTSHPLILFFFFSLLPLSTALLPPCFPPPTLLSILFLFSTLSPPFPPFYLILLSGFVLSTFLLFTLPLCLSPSLSFTCRKKLSYSNRIELSIGNEILRPNDDKRLVSNIPLRDRMVSIPLRDRMVSRGITIMQ